MTKVFRQTRAALGDLLDAEGGLTLVLTFPALVYFFASMAFQPF